MAFNVEGHRKLREKAGAQKQDFTVVSRGHDVCVKHVKVLDFVAFMSLEELQALCDAWDTKKPLEERVEVCLSSPGARCLYCNVDTYLFDGFCFYAKEECGVSEGFCMQVPFSCPSGRLVVGNNFLSSFDDEEKDYSLAEFQSIKKSMEWYAEQGLLFFFVSNTSPDVYQLGKDVVFASGELDFEPKVHPQFGEWVGNVCTDLWWVCVVDGDEAKKRDIKTSNNVFEIEVDPGEYCLEYNGLKRSFKFDVEAKNLNQAFAVLKKT